MKMAVSCGKILGFVSIGLVILIIVIGTNLFTVSGQPASPPGGSDESKPLKIGVVNMVGVFNKFKKREEYTASLEKEKIEQHKDIRKIEDKIIRLRKEIEAFENVGSILRDKKELQMRIESLKMESLVKSWNIYINEKVNEQTAMLYNEIRETIDNYAQLNSFDLILKTDPNMDEDSEENATLRINTRAILYYTKSMDITEEIVKILNKE